MFLADKSILNNTKYFRFRYHSTKMFHLTKCFCYLWNTISLTRNISIISKTLVDELLLNNKKSIKTSICRTICLNLPVQCLILFFYLGDYDGRTQEDQTDFIDFPVRSLKHNWYNIIFLVACYLLFLVLQKDQRT